jgi:hypothetical protein
MKLSSVVFVVLLLTTCITGVAQTPAPAKVLSPLEQTLIASEETLIEAKKKDDGAFFKRTVCDDFALVGVDGKLLVRQ